MKVVASLVVLSARLWFPVKGASAAIWMLAQVPWLFVMLVFFIPKSDWLNHMIKLRVPCFEAFNIVRCPARSTIIKNSSSVKDIGIFLGQVDDAD